MFFCVISNWAGKRFATRPDNFGFWDFGSTNSTTLFLSCKQSTICCVQKRRMLANRLRVLATKIQPSRVILRSFAGHGHGHGHDDHGHGHDGHDDHDDHHHGPLMPAFAENPTPRSSVRFLLLYI